MHLNSKPQDSCSVAWKIAGVEEVETHADERPVDDENLENKDLAAVHADVSTCSPKYRHQIASMMIQLNLVHACFFILNGKNVGRN